LRDEKHKYGDGRNILVIFDTWEIPSEKVVTEILHEQDLYHQ